MRDFYSHAPRGARLLSSGPKSPTIQFLLTRPSRGATHRGIGFRSAYFISTHTPLAGRDQVVRGHAEIFGNFYSHAPRGARLEALQKRAELTEISTHTPLAGRDIITAADTILAGISTHTPLAGRDPAAPALLIPLPIFLLTRPSRGATIRRRGSPSFSAFLLTRPSRGATHNLAAHW